MGSSDDRRSHRTDRGNDATGDPHAADPADPAPRPGGRPAEAPRAERGTGGALDTAAAAPAAPEVTVNAGLASDSPPDDDLLAPGDG